SRFEALLKQAISNSMSHPEATGEYVRQHAAEIDGDILAEHIKTFVNDYSLDLGDDGRSAVAEMQHRAQEAGIIK
ncbi:MAG: 1,4-dihydroxy-6-naphthoate synthase, partial [bacterium]|nr:1,4-dihydroxy-6-naphthoate synthase [bacterium]